MTDTFHDRAESLESPPSHIFAVEPNDGADLPFVSRCLNVAEAGTVRVTTLGGETATITLSAGIVFPVRAQRIWATGTTATGIVALY